MSTVTLLVEDIVLAASERNSLTCVVEHTDNVEVTLNAPIAVSIVKELNSALVESDGNHRLIIDKHTDYCDDRTQHDWLSEQCYE